MGNKRQPELVDGSNTWRNILGDEDTCQTELMRESSTSQSICHLTQGPIGSGEILFTRVKSIIFTYLTLNFIHCFAYCVIILLRLKINSPFDFGIFQENTSFNLISGQ